jgi:hypothetical protein
MRLSIFLETIIPIILNCLRSFKISLCNNTQERKHGNFAQILQQESNSLPTYIRACYILVVWLPSKKFIKELLELEADQE